MKKSITALFMLLFILGCFSAQVIFADQMNRKPGSTKSKTGQETVKTG